MKALTKTLLLVLIAFAGQSQQREFIIKDIFPTQTSTAIHAHFILPFKMSFKVEKRQFKNNYRPSYIYHFTPHIKEFKDNKIELYVGYSSLSDSSIIKRLSSGDYIKLRDSERFFYDGEYLVTFKGDEFLSQRYNFILRVKHNQKKEDFDIKKLLWFVDIAKSWELTHGNHH